VQTLCNSTLGYLGVVLLRLSAVHPLLPLLVVAVLLLCLHFLVKLSSAKAMKKLSTNDDPQQVPSLIEEGPRDAPLRGDAHSLIDLEAPQDTSDRHENVEAAQKDTSEARLDLESYQEDEEESSDQDQSLWLERFLSASALGSSSSDSSSGQFWNQMLSLWSSKSESSDEWRHPHSDSVSECSNESNSDESDHSGSESESEEEDPPLSEGEMRQGDGGLGADLC
jgi:hypothetical protein